VRREENAGSEDRKNRAEEIKRSLEGGKGELDLNSSRQENSHISRISSSEENQITEGRKSWSEKRKEALERALERGE